MDWDVAQAANSWAQKQQKKQEQKSEGEEHGKLEPSIYICLVCWSKLLTPYRRHLLHFWVRHHNTALKSHTDPPSPVIIAENMIGCAMYELVCATKCTDLDDC